MMRGAFFVQSGNPKQSYPNKDFIPPKPGSFVTRLTRFSGALSFCSVMMINLNEMVNTAFALLDYFSNNSISISPERFTT